MREQHKAYAYWLNSIPGIGNKSIAGLLKAFGSPKEVYKGTRKQYQALLQEGQVESLIDFTRTWSPEKEYEKLREMKIEFVTLEEEQYPRRLQTIPDAPYGIFYKGGLPSYESLSVAVVGARECSEYGRFVARELGRWLGENGVQVISGMARGIDGIAQEAAMLAGGTSYGVLGCGVDICYPKQNGKIYKQLLAKGGILSLYPPGTEPQARLFPPRNRIVSGLADAVVVIEARQKSGTLITVDMALEQGKEVYVVPGRITDRLSDGCNKLLQQGAEVFLTPKDFLEELRTLYPQKTGEVVRKKVDGSEGSSERNNEKSNEKNNERSKEEKGEITDSGIEKEMYIVLNSLELCPLSVEQIRERLPKGYGYSKTITLLMRLCMKGEAAQAGSGYFVRTGGQNFIKKL